MNLASALGAVSLVMGLLVGCSTDSGQKTAGPLPSRSIATQLPTHSPTPTASTTEGPTEGPSEGPTDGHRGKDGADKEVVVRYRLVRRVSDPATENFERVAESTLEDARGWERADFNLIRTEGARFRVVLAEGPVVDRLCLPYETHSTYSCQNGPVVALNADRWRTATSQWTGTLSGYQRMLVNHEVGHLLGQHHPEIQCPVPGELAPVMAQQSTELNGCLPNPWPLPHEVKRAARHELPLAPPYEEDV